MARQDRSPTNLAAGEFFGNVPNKRSLPSAILSEVVHRDEFEVPEHYHELAYFTFIVGGSYTERFCGTMTDHRPMSLLWHQAGISHKDRIGAGGARCFTIEIKHNGLSGLRDYAEVPSDFVEIGTSMVWTAARLFREFRNWEDASDLVAEGLTLEMLGLAAQRRDLYESRPPAWLRKVVERLNEEYTGSISTSALAEDIDVHPVHLASVFRRFRGETIGEYIQGLRVHHASKLLPKLDVPLVEIAYSAGFSDQSHFNRLFKRRTGMTPGEFRRSLT